MNEEMNENQINSSYKFMDKLTKKWWLYLIFVLVVFIPPLSSKGFTPFSEVESMVRYVADILIEKKEVLVPYMPIFHIAVAIYFGLVIILGNKFGRMFALFAGIHTLFLMWLKASAVTPRYGWVFYPNGFILITSIALCWFWEAIVRKTDFTLRKLTLKDVGFVLIAVFAFWNPDKMGYYSPIQLLTSTSPIAFCMMLSIHLSFLCILYPNVNIPMLRIISFIVIPISIISMSLGLFFEVKSEGIYWIFLHSPMFIISVYSFRLAIRHSE
jgi:hypothetical protein